MLFLCSLSLIAFCYAAVGHGGASGYIAVFALFGMVSPSMKSFVLVLNLGVALIAFYQYYSKGHFNLKYFIPFCLGAAPMAYLGAKLELEALTYRYLLAGFLLFSVCYLLGLFNQYKTSFQSSYAFWKAVILAMAIGLISGIAGVGGGIFLSPVLLMLGWLNLKQTAALSALFIAVNSLAGLLAIQQYELLASKEMLTGFMLVIIFGYLGSRWGVHLEKPLVLRRMLAFVLLIAAFKLCLV